MNLGTNEEFKRERHIIIAVCGAYSIPIKIKFFNSFCVNKLTNKNMGEEIWQKEQNHATGRPEFCKI